MLAALFPRDVGIAGHKSVILHENFSDYTNGINTHICEEGAPAGQRWRGLRVSQYGEIEDGAMKLSLPASDTELSLGFWQWLDSSVFDTQNQPQPKVIKTTPGGYDELYLRYYQKFDVNYCVTGSNHCGPNLSASYNLKPHGQASPGHKANGYNKLLISYEFWRGEAADTPPGKLNFYVYHPLQGGIYGDHFFPTGHISVSEGLQSAAMSLDPSFIPRPDFTPQLGKWHCYEFCVKLNTVLEEGEYHFANPSEYVMGGDRGEAVVTKKPIILHDGRITGWVDGEVVADFPGLALRYTNDLKLDDVIFSQHAKESNRENAIWYRDIVLATEYVGSIQSR